MKYLIWVKDAKGKPTVEILNGLDQNIDSHGKDKKEILQQHELNEIDAQMSLTQLVILFPYKG